MVLVKERTMQPSMSSTYRAQVHDFGDGYVLISGWRFDLPV